MGATTTIEIQGNNLYYNGTINSYPADGELELVREKLDIQPEEGDDYHTIVDGDTCDSIAFKYFKDKVQHSSQYWWVIADANDDVIYDPLDLSDLLGTKILVPDILRIRLIQ